MPNRVEQGACRKFLWWKPGYPAMITVFPLNPVIPAFISGFPNTHPFLPCFAWQCKLLKCSLHLEAGRNLNGLGLILKKCLLLNQIATNWWSKIPSGTDDWPQSIGFKVFMKSLFLQSKECKRTNKLRENIRKYEGSEISKLVQYYEENVFWDFTTLVRSLWNFINWLWTIV